MIIPKDDMTSLERMAAFWSGKDYDRVPCSPFLGETAVHLIGTTVSKYRHSAKLMADVDEFTYRMFGHDGAGVGPGFLGMAESMGTILRYPEDNIPFVQEPVLKDWADFKKLEPSNPYKDGKLPVFLEALDMIKDRLGKEVGVGSGVGGPFTTASMIRGTANFLRDLYRNTEMVHCLLKLVTQSALSYVDAVIDKGCGVNVIDPTASGTIISVKQFREFAKPYIKIICDRVIERTGAGPMLHICGDTTLFLEDMVETGISVLSLDNIVDLSTAKNVVGDRVCLLGNVKPVDTIMKGTNSQIESEVKDCLRKAYDNPKGYILATGCQIPLGTPPENVNSFMNAARIYGRYPYDPERWI